MTRNTTRDRVWLAVFEAMAAARQGNADGWTGDRITADVVDERLEDPPSRRTTRDVLATMAEMGFLETGRQGQYRARDGIAGPFDLELQEDEDDDRQLAQHNQADPEIGIETPPRDGGIEQNPPGIETPPRDTAVDRAVQEAEQTTPPADLQAEARDELEAVEFPSTKDREDCLEAVLAARAYLIDEGPATMREIVVDVMPDYPLGYDVPELEEGERYRGSWWRKVVKPGLEALEDVDKPAPSESNWSVREERKICSESRRSLE